MHEFLKYVKLYTDCDDDALKRLEPLLNKYILKPKIIFKEKIVEIVRYHKFNVQPYTSIDDFFNEYKTQTNVSIDDIRKRCRTTETLKKRNLFIRSAMSYGYTASSIARFLKMDHSTILHTIKKSKL